MATSKLHGAILLANAACALSWLPASIWLETHFFDKGPFAPMAFGFLAIPASVAIAVYRWERGHQPLDDRSSRMAVDATWSVALAIGAVIEVLALGNRMNCYPFPCGPTYVPPEYQHPLLGVTPPFGLEVGFTSVMVTLWFWAFLIVRGVSLGAATLFTGGQKAALEKRWIERTRKLARAGLIALAVLQAGLVLFYVGGRAYYTYVVDRPEPEIP